MSTESGWYPPPSAQIEADAITESRAYYAGVDVDAALGAGFDAAVRAVLHVNATGPDATGVERVALLREALRGDT